MQYEILRKMNYTKEQILYVGETQLFNSYRRSLLHMGLDPILGYGKFSEEKKSMLFTKHVWISDDNMKPVRIVVLGGSNTDEDVARNKSWPEYLCEYLQNQNISYELYNGGTTGYNVSQELLKLIRDAVLLKPDICISYSSVNNIFKATHLSLCVDDFPFIHRYQKTVYDNLRSHVEGADKGRRAECTEWGIKYEGEWGDFWVSQIRMQKAVCEEFSIRYISVLQPNLFTKKYFAGSEQELLAWLGICIENGSLKFFDDRWQKCWEENKAFQDKISEKIKDIDYIYDMRPVFDDVEDVYIDWCHIRSFGNKIIAKKIYELLDFNYE